MNKKNTEIIETLRVMYPDAQIELVHDNPLQLLVATILSAQATDKKVNEVTGEMFKKYKTLDDFLTFTYDELVDYIKVIGLYKSKGRNLIKTFKMLRDDFDGEVPGDMESLIKLPGVGRKTANVVLSTAFNIPSIAVDTHVFRITNRLGIVNEKNVEATERALMKKLDRDIWIEAHHLFIFHGRNLCTARSPQCGICPLNTICTYYKKNKSKLITK